MTTTAEAPERLLDRVRKLLAKAEAEGVTAAEAQALTAKAAELMAKYGIDRALLAARQPETDKPDDRVVDIYNPWARVQAHLLCGLAAALRCQCILLPSPAGQRVHMFGYASDLERADVLYTSVLIQMWHGLAGADVPAGAHSARAWRRSWLLGFSAAVIARVRAAEQSAEQSATARPAGDGSASAALVLADRSLVIRRHVARAYPVTRSARLTYSGSGYGDGYAQGKRADIGAGRIRGRRARALTG
jgi:cytosine/adenosine deaminase-related metal-dependent hydrolase